MLLSNTTEVLNTRLSDAEAIEFMAKAGFDAFDMSFMHITDHEDHPLNQEHYREYAHMLRKTADKAGIICNQAHAPMHSKFGEPEFDHTFLPKILRAIECASILGAKIIVVHPIQCLSYSENADQLREMNINFYKSLIPYCEKYQIKVAIENMYQYNKNTKKYIHSTCSRAEEFCDYIDNIDSEWIVACLDIGHVALVGEDIPRMIRMLGHRLQALHVHDNDYNEDLHSMPYFFQIKFNQMAKALKDIHYSGDMTLEAGNIYAKLPRRTWESAAGLMLELGRHMVELVRSTED